MVGEVLLYKGKFRKMRVEHQNLLSCLLIMQVPVATALTVVSHARKEYSFLKPSMVHGDCDKKKLTKFIGEARIWLNKTITEEEKKECFKLLYGACSTLNGLRYLVGFPILST